MQFDNGLIQAVANNGIALVMLVLLLLSIRSFVLFVAPIVQRRMESDLLLITAMNDALRELIPIMRDIRSLCELIAHDAVGQTQERERNK